MNTIVRSFFKFRSQCILLTSMMVVIFTCIAPNAAYAVIVTEINLAGSDSADDASLGKDNSSVSIIEYGDYQCPYSAQYYQGIEAKIRNEYVKTGKVKIIFKNQQFLGNESIMAAAAAECAKDQGKFWPYHDALYDSKIRDTRNGGSENDGVFNRDLFFSLASQMGLDTALFAHCYDSKKYVDTIKSESAAAVAQGVHSTPTIFVNGRLVEKPITYGKMVSMFK